MRILTFTSLFPSSCDPTHAIFVYQRCAHLARRPDNEVIVVSPVPYFPSWLKTNRWRTASQVPTEERIGSLTVYHPRYFLLPKIFMTLHAVSMFLGCRPEVARLNERAKLDCIDAHFVYPDGLAAVLLGKFLGVPVIVSARGSDIHAYPAFRTIRPMIRWTLQHADALIAVSASLKKSMIELGASADKIHVIPNGIDPVRFQPLPISQARQELNLPVDAPFIVSVGALIPSKGHQFLVRAFGRIAGRHPDMRLAILGEGPLRSQLEKLILELGLRDRVHLLGKRPNEELRLWYSAATASCLASAGEGWPNVVTESLTCGTPVVATRVGGIPEILQSSEFGVLVEQSVDAIAAGLEEALSRSWDRETISQQTLARTWETVAAEVEDVLQEAVRGRVLSSVSRAKEQTRKAP
ncbi:MAG: glycosyltransferase [Acidobacteria bacterium]|nr:MAG: glycosyltransferase [Acidobacteriota bacterium]